MSYIKKINKYLLENYPLIWNTRLVWMMLTALVLHLAFFIAGFLFVNNQLEVSSEYRLDKFYFDTSVVFTGILLSIIILLVWVIYYLQNNAFKNLYHLKKGTLFKQFCCIVTIIFLNITQFYSFNVGLKLKIRTMYDWSAIDTDIKEWNRLSIFLLEHSTDYNIDHKQYPDPFPLNHAKDEMYKLGISVDTTKHYFTYGDYHYQFYKLDHDKMEKDNENINSYAGHHAMKEVDYLVGEEYDRKHNFKYRIVHDISGFEHLIEQSLFNYSDKLYRYGQDSTDHKKRLAYYEELLNKKDEKEIEKAILPFFDLAKKYQVAHNLNMKDWLYLLNTENNYHFRENIRDRDPTNEYEYEKIRLDYYRNISVTDTISLKGRNEKELLYLKRHPLTKDGQYALVERTEKEYFKEVPYCNLGRLDNFFSNVYESYNQKFDESTLYVYIVISLVIGLLLFLFKVTDIRTLLLSFVAASVLLIVLILTISNLPNFMKELFGRKYVEMIISLFIGVCVIVFSIISLKKRWNKLITAILFSLSLYIIPLIFVALFGLYTTYLRVEHNLRTNSFIEWFEVYGFVTIISLWILGIALYLLPIRKWKGLPE